VPSLIKINKRCTNCQAKKQKAYKKKQVKAEFMAKNTITPRRLFCAFLAMTPANATSRYGNPLGGQLSLNE
jgi:hypothetical protein